MELDSTQDKPEIQSSVDPWELPEFTQTATPWRELSVKRKLKRVTIGIGKFSSLTGLIYLFICSLTLLSSAFRLLGGKTAGEVFSSDSLLVNPLAGLVVGILVTVVFQSSSTTTSIVVAMVSSEILTVEHAIPIVMGANIGTSVTNILVSLGHAGERDQFRRAFAGATIHDVFNWLCVLILLPCEVVFGYLYHLTKLMTKKSGLSGDEERKFELFKRITKPFTNLIIQIDNNVLEQLAKGELETDKSLIRSCKDVLNSNSTTNKTTTLTDQKMKPCIFIFHDTGLSDTIVGIILLCISLFILCTCLLGIVKILHSLLSGHLAQVVKRTINADFPGFFKHLTGYFAILVGAGMTILLQSSSVFTSTLTPLVGVGIVTIDRIYPLTLGANVGTTGTAILAALASTENFDSAIQIALCHLFFNLSGILIFYPISFMRKIPIKLAKKLGNITSKYRWFAVLYLLVCFFLFPAAMFGLSIAGLQVMLAVLLPLIALLLFVIVLNVMQVKCVERLPSLLQTWEWVPCCFRSLKPYDRKIENFLRFCRTCCHCINVNNRNNPSIEHSSAI
ncbi:sodium-dependent phosphate transport protein 2B-like isoform X3 [Xenia sp. Carnegie-2017]|nr:sodium-dependent phosphate transport protein 2B-like isoform X3 [Xenia sp. Carnegie-2017]